MLIWWNRNLLVHKGEGLHIPLAAYKTKLKIAEMSNSSFKISVVSDEGATSWCPAKVNFLKFNRDRDGAWSKNKRKAGFGCVIRDSDSLIYGCSMV